MKTIHLTEDEIKAYFMACFRAGQHDNINIMNDLIKEITK